MAAVGMAVIVEAEDLLTAEVTRTVTVEVTVAAAAGMVIDRLATTVAPVEAATVTEIATLTARDHTKAAVDTTIPASRDATDW